MSVNTKTQLGVLAQQINNETTPGANTCVRNGTMLQNIVDSMVAQNQVTRTELNTLRLAGTISTSTSYIISNAVSGNYVLEARALINTDSIFVARNLMTKENGYYYLILDVFVPQGCILTAPTVDNDVANGFYVGQVLRTLDTNTHYLCTSATSGAAVWLPIGSVQFSLALSAANLASGPRFDIPQLVELPAGYMWNIINVVVDYTYGTEDYDSLALSIEVVGANTIAFDDAGTIGGAHNSMTFLMQPYYNQADGTMKATGRVRVNIDGTPTTGDGTVKIYGLAQLIKLI